MPVHVVVVFNVFHELAVSIAFFLKVSYLFRYTCAKMNIMYSLFGSYIRSIL